MLFAREGVLLACICDNAGEIVQVNFYQKLNNKMCHLKQLEPFTPQSHALDRKTRELKKGVSHKMPGSRAPSAYGVTS